MPLRWGIVAAGKICHDFTNAFNSYPNKGDQVIVAVAARDKQRASDFAKTHNIEKVYDSYQKLAQSNDIDVAYIGALNPNHYELAKLFLENGKHVLCEKPLCLNYKQTASLINFAKQKKLFLMEAVWSRFSPAYIALEKEINAGKLGDVKFVEVNFGVPIYAVDRLRKKQLGGSAILDLGIYNLQFAQYIFKDEPIKITAVGDLNEDGVDMADTVILDYTGGRRAVLNISSRLKLWNKATVVGTAGRMTIGIICVGPPMIYPPRAFEGLSPPLLKALTERDRQLQPPKQLEDPFHFPDTLINVDGKVEKFNLHTLNVPSNFENSAGLVYQTLEVARCIREGLTESPRMSHQDSLLLAKLEDTVRQQVGVHFDVDSKEYP